MSLRGLAFLLGSSTLVLAQNGLTIAPPVRQPSPPPAATQPASPAIQTPTTLSSPEKVLEGLLTHETSAPVTAPAMTNSRVLPAGESVAPNAASNQRIREGSFIWNRIGRLARDEKSTQWMVVFEADGDQLKDPPMLLLPNRMLMAMEAASDNGRKSVRFRISGQVTEYHQRNYLLITFMQTVKDMGQF